MAALRSLEVYIITVKAVMKANESLGTSTSNEPTALDMMTIMIISVCSCKIMIGREIRKY